MLITTRSASSLARSTRRRWPSWRKPIVGTNPTRRPRACSARVQARMSERLVISCMLLLEGMLRVGILAVAHFRRESLHGLLDLLGEVRVALDELRRKAVVQPEQVVEHQHLAVAVLPRPDADGGNRERLRDLGRERRGNQLQDDRECARVLEGLGILLQ